MKLDDINEGQDADAKQRDESVIGLRCLGALVPVAARCGRAKCHRAKRKHRGGTELNVDSEAAKRLGSRTATTQRAETKRKEWKINNEEGGKGGSSERKGWSGGGGGGDMIIMEQMFRLWKRQNKTGMAGYCAHTLGGVGYFTFMKKRSIELGRKKARC
eukprot:5722211-Pleurochrysis_carterae.AAC.1